MTDYTDRLRTVAAELEDILYLLDMSYQEQAFEPAGISTPRLSEFVTDAFHAIDNAMDEIKAGAE